MFRADEKTKTFICKTCKKEYMTKYNLLLHRRSHINIDQKWRDMIAKTNEKLVQEAKEKTKKNQLVMLPEAEEIKKETNIPKGDTRNKKLNVLPTKEMATEKACKLSPTTPEKKETKNSMKPTIKRIPTNYKTYSNQQKIDLLVRATEVGLVIASKQLKIPISTSKHWKRLEEKFRSTPLSYIQRLECIMLNSMNSPRRKT